jgi:hypothetical protein
MTGRGTRACFGSAGELADPVPVPRLGPVVFSLSFGGMEKVVDLSDLVCPLLVRPLAAALASIGGDNGTIRTWSPGFAQRVTHLRTFVTFAAGVLGPAAGLADVTPRLLDDFEVRLSRRFGAGAGPVGVYLATVVRLMRLAAQDGGTVLPVELQARLSCGATERCEPSVPLDAYPLPVLAAVRDVALADVRSITARLDAGRALAATGHDPQAAGWHARENVLWHVLEHGPLTASRMRELGWHSSRHGGARELNDELFLGVNDLVPFLVAVICLTGLEPECAKGLRGDCLSSPSGGFWTLAYDKPRAHTGTGKTIRVRSGSAVTPAGLIQLAMRLTQPARDHTASTALWVAAGDNGLRAYFDQGHQMNTQVQAWMARHQLDQLTDYGGGPVRLDLAAAQDGEIREVPGGRRRAGRLHGRTLPPGRGVPLCQHRRAPGDPRTGRRSRPGTGAGGRAPAAGRHTGRCRAARDADIGPAPRSPEHRQRRVPRFVHELQRLAVRPQAGRAVPGRGVGLPGMPERGLRRPAPAQPRCIRGISGGPAGGAERN